VLVIVTFLTPAAWSYGAALAAPGNVALSVRSVEWVRDNHGRWLVNDIENFWYNHHRPKKGALPKQSLTVPAGTPPSGTPVSTGASAAVHPATTVPPGPSHLPAPAPLAPIVSPALPNEGQWQPIGQLVGGVPAMYASDIRPDPVYTSVVATVAWMDPSLVRTALYAGVEEPTVQMPGGGEWRYHAPITAADWPNLLAAFNSGFKLADSRGGYYSEGRIVRPLRDGAATLVIKTDGTPTVGEWGRDVQMGPDVAFARQNLSLIVDNGAPVPDIASSNYKWGATLGNKVLVWRSGIGVTATGALVYAAGNNLSAPTLAATLARAGAVRAMELDINSAWVSFFTYTPVPGQLTHPAGTKLIAGMQRSPDDYFGSNSRDFIVLFRRFP
jgi:hypothetical protein